MTAVSNAIYFYTTDNSGRPVHFTLSEAVASIVWERKMDPIHAESAALTEDEIVILIGYLNLQSRHPREMYQRILRYRARECASL